jgi:CRP-like cAMP-binding protein
VAKHLSHLIAMHEARAHDHLINNASRDAHGRIAHLLIELYFRQRHRLPAVPNETIDLPLTLALIGEAVGLTPVHVSRSLRRLREERVLRLHRGRLLIIDPDALIRTSGVDDRPLADATIPC